MKKLLVNIYLILFAILLINTKVFTQNQKEKIAVLHIDSRNVHLESRQVGDLVRMELEKFDTFEVIDRYDVTDILDKKQIKYDGVYGKERLVNIGDSLNVDLMLSGTVEKISDIIVITYRLIDVKSNKIIKTHLIEYIDNEKELATMIKATLKSMFNKPVEEIILDKLTKRYDYDNQINNPNATRLSLGGPRIGFVTIWGEAARIMALDKYDGGFEAQPIISQFGYQIEFQYLNTKRVQALLEIIPSISGIEQQLFKPNLILLNGVRDSKTGFEFGIGPIVGMSTESEFVKYQGNEMRINDYKKLFPNEQNIKSYSRIDSKGTEKLDLGVMIAIGKSFKSGKLNIPVNLFVTIPNKNGFSIGLSFGYNAKIHRN